MVSQSSLNHIYRTVWNEALGAMVAVAENCSSHQGGAGASTAVKLHGAVFLGTLPRWGVLSLAVALCWGVAPHVQANPTGGVAVQGQATMASKGNVLTVTTQNAPGTNYSAINWQSFSIPLDSTTRIDQPNASSMSINRVVTNTPSVLFGSLSSNGKIVLVNQSGIAVGAGAQVDTAGFTASVLSMSDQDSMAGRLRFGNASLSAGSSGTLAVQGNIIGRGGDVVLIAPNIEMAKSAVVESQGGSVLLAAGRSVEITGRGLEGITMQVQAPGDQVVNLGTLKGDAVGIFAGTLRHSGQIQANQASVEGGRVVLKASGDAYVEGDGRIIASSSNGKGGSVSVLGNRVALTDHATIDVSGATGGGTVLVGGDYQGKNASVQNASMSYVGKDTRIVADAIDNGNGGKVVVWADDTTRAYGNVAARGGANGGNGGQVETSGRRYLDYQGHTDTLAPHGQAGNLLLDPTNITINGGPDVLGGGTFGGGIFSGATSDSTVSWTTINAQSGNITLQTSAGGASVGDINVATSGNVSAFGSFTLNAANNINFGGGVAITGGGAPVTLIAGSNINFSSSSSLSTTNTVAMTAPSGITLAGLSAGNLNLTTTSGNITQASGIPVTVGGVTTLNAGTGDIVLQTSGNSFPTIGLTGGAVKVTAGGAMTVTALNNGANKTVVLAAGGALTLPGNAINTGSADLQLGSGAALSPPNDLTGANIKVVAPSADFQFNVTASGTLDVTASAGSVTQSTGSGAIKVTGATTINATGGQVSLMQAGNDFSTVSATATAGPVWFQDMNAVVLNAISASGTNAIDIQAGGAVSQAAGTISTGGTFTLNSVGGATLNNSNNVASLNATNTGSGGFSYKNSGALSATVNNTAPDGTVTVISGGNLTLAAGGISSNAAATNAVTLVTAAAFNDGGQSISLGGAGTPRWLIYSNNQAANSVASLISTTKFQQYGAGYPAAAAQATGNGILYSVNSGPVSASLTGSTSKVYDSTTAATLSTTNYTGLGSVVDTYFGTSTAVVVSGAGSGTYSSPNVGSGIMVTSAGGSAQISFAGGLTIYGYLLGSSSAAIGTITPAPVIVAGGVSATLIGNTSKTYDGTTLAVLTPGNFALSGFVGTDSASVSKTTGSFATKDAGSNLLVSTTLAPSDFTPVGATVLSNYSLPTSASGNIGTIKPKPLTSIPTAANKVFDGNTTAVVTGYGLNGFVPGETVGATSTSANFDTKDVGTGKTVTIGGISLVNGTGLASNYSVANTATALANITAPGITPPNPPPNTTGTSPITASTPTDFVVTFLDKFEVAVAEQEHKKGDPAKVKSDLVLEGETCRP